MVDEPNGLSWADGTKVVLVTDDGSIMPRFARLSDGMEGWVMLGNVARLEQGAVKEEAELKEEQALATIQFDPEPEQSIRVGVPFSWGALISWYMKTQTGSIIRLTDGVVSLKAEARFLDESLVYAKSMELR